MEDSKTLDILMEIKENVASLNQKFTNLEKNMSDTNKRHEAEITSVRGEVAELKREIAEIKQRDTKEDAQKWRKTTGYIFAVLGTSVVTFMLAHISDLITSLGAH